jgi:hypothetical protein
VYAEQNEANLDTIPEDGEASGDTASEDSASEDTASKEQHAAQQTTNAVKASTPASPVREGLVGNIGNVQIILRPATKSFDDSNLPSDEEIAGMCIVLPEPDTT